MTASVSNGDGPSVALAVRPPLLRDVLARALSASGAEVVVVPDDPSELALDLVGRRYDIAMISGALPPALEADLVLIVAPPDGDEAPIPPVQRSPDVIDIVHLDEVLAAIDDWRREHAVRAGGAEAAGVVDTPSSREVLGRSRTARVGKQPFDFE